MSNSLSVATPPSPARAKRPPRDQDPRNPRARLEAFFDPGSCELICPDDLSGVLAATGDVDGVRAMAFCSDATVQGGAMGETGCQLICTAYEKALAAGVPVVGLWHSGGARLQEGVTSLHAVGQVFAVMTRASGRIPQISVVLGAAAGGAAYGPALTDLVVMADDGRIFVTGPDVVRSLTGEDVDALSLGGTEPHGRRSGVVHVVAGDEADALAHGRRLVGLLGSQGVLDLDAVEDRDLGDILPESPRRAYDVRPLVDRILDAPGLELHPRWSPNIVTSLGRLGGRTVGVIANNPLRLAGCLDSASAEKAARFVRMCDAFGVPLVVVTDVPGYLPPTAEVAVMGAVAAVRILHRRKLAEVPAELVAQVEEELAAEHQELSGGLARAVEIGVVDEVIEPSATRTALARSISEARQVRGNHANIPL